jgi:hypothetical protein
MTETTRYFFAKATITLVTGERVLTGFYARHSDSLSADDTQSAGLEIAREIICDWGSDELDAPVEDVEVTRVKLVSAEEFFAAPRHEVKG